MGLSLFLGRYFGIPVKVHWTFALLLMYIAHFGYSNGLSSNGLIWLLVFVIALFICVILHELGHALAARYYGIDTKDIILSPIGGLARLRGMPKKPFHEFMIAICGPLVNVVIAIVLFFILYFQGEFSFEAIEFDGDLPSFERYFWPILLIYNIILVVFNMIPAFPMDGGRVLRSLLAMRMKITKATRISSIIGKSLAFGFFIFGIWQGSFTLPIIGVFIYFAAHTEYRNLIAREVYDNGEVKDIVSTEIQIYTPDSGAGWILQQMMAHVWERAYIVDNANGNYYGVIDREQLAQQLKVHGALEEIAPFAIRGYFVFLDDSLRLAAVRLNSSARKFIPVFDRGMNLVGEISDDMIRDLMKRTYAGI